MGIRLVFPSLMLTAALFALGFAAYAWPRRRTREARYFIWVMFAAAIYSFASAVENVSVNFGAILFWGKATYVGVAAIAPLWFMFVLQATGRSPTWTPARLALLWAIPVVVVVLVWTNEWHGFVWPRISLLQDAFGARLIYEHGPGVWLIAAYAYTLYIFGATLLFRAAWEAHGARRHVWGLLLVASTIPFISNALYLLGWGPWPGIDLTPLGVIIAGILMVAGQLRAPLFDALPVVEHALFDSLSDLVILLDGQDHVLNLNPAARSTLGLETAPLGSPLSELHPALAALVARLSPYHEGKHETVQWELKRSDAGASRRVFDVRSAPLRAAGLAAQPGGHVYGRVLTVREVTSERDALEAVARRARQMELLSAITQSALDTPNLYALLQSVADRLAELFSADGAFVTLWDDEHKTVRPAAAYGEMRVIYPTLQVLPGEANFTEAVLATGRPLVVADPANTPHLSARLAALMPKRACMALPLIAGDLKLGAAIVDYNQPHIFDDEQIALGEQVARVIALVLAKARLYEAERWRLAELTALQSISAAVAASLDLQQVFDSAVRLLHETFGYASIGIYRPEGEMFVLGAQMGCIPAQIFSQISVTQGIIGRAVRTRTLQFVRDVHSDPDYRMANEMIACEICAPLLKEDRVLGVLNIENPAERPFTENDVRLMQAFANQLAVAIENAELYAGERAQRQLAEALREVGLALSQTLELDDLLDRMLESIRRVVPYDAAYFMIMDESGERALVARRTGFYQFGADVDAEIRNLALELATTENLRHMALTGQPSVIPVIDAEPNWVRFKASNFLHSWAGAPVMVDGKAAAFITVEHRQPGFYRDEHLQPLATFAGQAGIAVQNARLFREVREQVQREQRLFAATRDFTSRLGETAVLEAITHHMIEALQADACTISRWEPEGDRVVTDRDHARCPEMQLEPAGTAYALSDYPVTRRVIESREAVFLIAADPQVDEGERSAMQSCGAGMVLILPLAAGREAPVYGVVELYRAVGGRNFSENELEMARNLAAQAAQAIENARLFAEVQRLAVMDELTGLYNRRGFFELGRREHERAMRYHHALSAIFVDIDHFKLFNDAFSYAVGDQALRLVANCLRETTRETDLIGRYGGEEFVALLPETDLKAAMRVAERVRKAVGQMRVKTGWGEVNLTVSIGVRQSSEDTPTLDYLIDAAGQSLHTAKEHGRNRVAAR